ncbi:putative oxidoreductase [Mycobacteroides abscessus 6G-0212]|uniref:Oxidoreductase n=1 Tax=Mycobacteroides abscessus (strain ATCC 19977 / DSM 44196 / CCUG 20993 / CIP 104536 / JCM 13569 / NCTC 13031 / TMC 1543 / L948) TaxID=561007 RepID=B1MIA1_MYCA9|nr:putative oxidoreductase [Mycobacteroides abscessus 6G-1108]EIU99537.1 putative oxidoreductase [Mycobacteroides abscessus 6G-0212]ETZ65878.1 flavin oxidoreductase / NADH oxidase family protein [Mycobacteroides abscessus MAB_110811_2726]CAM60923.1 Putative oxidoreductase [Mycobacteroides abscessus ATCC 19977]
MENRQRFVIEVARRVAEEIGPERTGIRLSPGGEIGEIEEGDNYVDEYIQLAEKLSELSLVYIHIAFLRPTTDKDDQLLRRLREAYDGVVIVNRGGRPAEYIGQDVSTGLADIESIGALALANPDLPRRLEMELPLNEPRKEFFYGGGREGYTDYPVYLP